MNEVKDQTLNYLTALSQTKPHKQRFWFQLIHSETGKARKPEYLLPTEANLKTLRKLNKNNKWDIFTTINKTDGKGRKTGNITEVRALFVDLDHGELPEAFYEGLGEQFKPTLAVKSSPGKCHLYWRMLDGGEIPLEKFSELQLILAKKFQPAKADPSVKDLPRILRVPGFIHNKSGKLSELIYYNPDNLYTLDKLFEVLSITEDIIEEVEGEVLYNSSGLTRQQLNSYQGSDEFGRHDAMMRQAVAYFRYNPGITEEKVRALLLIDDQLNRPPKFQNEECSAELEKIIRDAFKYSENLVSIPPVGPEILDDQFSGNLPTSLEINTLYDRSVDSFLSPVSESSYAERIYQRFGRNYKFIGHKTGLKYIPNIGSWKPFDAKNEAILFAKHEYDRVVRDSEKEISVIDTLVTKDGDISPTKVMTHFNKMYKKTTQDSVLALLRGYEELQAEESDLNTLVGYVAAKNGVINLSTGNLFEDSKDFLFTRRLGCEFDPEAKCPKFDVFMNGLMEGEEQEELITYMQQIVGTILAGDVSPQKFHVLHGPGGNGKSAFINVISALMGDYLGSLSANIITKKGNLGPGSVNDNRMNDALAALSGTRLCAVEELPLQCSWNIELIKTISGGDALQARQLYSSVSSLNVMFTLFIRANSLPDQGKADDAFMQRYSGIPFRNRFRGASTEVKAVDKVIIADELPGILNFAVRGYQSYLANGKKYDIPNVCRDDFDEYNQTVNPLGAFFDQCFVLNNKTECIPIRTKTLRQLFTAWLSSKFDVEDISNHLTESDKSFSTRLKGLGMSIDKRSKTKTSHVVNIEPTQGLFKTINTLRDNKCFENASDIEEICEELSIFK